jgi:hypothetical protein
MLLVRNNVKIRRESRLFESLVVVGVVTVITLAGVLYMLHDSCAKLGREVRRLESQENQLANDCLREQNRWNAMKTPERLDAALLHHGLGMALPRPDQIVRLTPRETLSGPRAYRERERLAGNNGPAR